jgi:primosomal protein N' (replication factor Y) (superfamily II helicase)
LNFPDFRAYERSFQLMAQVSGRAGRKNKQGKVIIQTTDKNHMIVKNVVNNDYEKMFLSQLSQRKEFKYPPFFRLIEFTVKHKQKAIADAAAEKLAEELRKVFGGRVLGPEAPIISRVKNWYIQLIVLKIERKIAPQKAKNYIRSAINKAKTIDKFKYVQFIADVDPM